MVNILPPQRQDESLKSKLAGAVGTNAGQGIGDLIKNIMSRRQSHPAQDVFNEMAQAVSDDEAGIGVSPLTFVGADRKGVENRNKFNSMRARLESILVPMVNKGNLSNTRFKFIMEQIPAGSDSQRAIVGKLHGLAKALADSDIPIDTSALLEVPFESESLSRESAKRNKIAFDANNPEHLKERERVFKKTKGNRAKANQVLSRKFSMETE